MTNEFDQGDYVLVPKSKAKISRARKGLIGFMVVGAIAAISGAGTFASFSAETANEATFSSGRLLMANRVDGANECLSSDTSIDTNQEECAALFSDLSISDTPSDAVVEIENESDSAQQLQLYLDPAAATACEASNAAYPEGSACSTAQLVIRKADPITLLPIAGGNCVFPAASALCNSTSTLSDANFDTLGTAASLTNFVGAFGASYDTATNIGVPIPFDDDGDNDESTGTDTRDDATDADDEVAYVFEWRLPNHARCGYLDGDDGTGADSLVNDGVAGDSFIGDPAGLVPAGPGYIYNQTTKYADDGVGCNNPLMNSTLSLALRWRFEQTIA